MSEIQQQIEVEHIGEIVRHAIEDLEQAARLADRLGDLDDHFGFPSTLRAHIAAIQMWAECP